MNVLVRGRISDGEWVDQQTIWKPDVETYTACPTWPPAVASRSTTRATCS